MYDLTGVGCANRIKQEEEDGSVMRSKPNPSNHDAAIRDHDNLHKLY